MTANRSLDEFAGETPAAAAGSGSESEESSGGGDRRAEPGDPEASGPVESTYEWTPDGAPCADCGEIVEERWRNASDLVCLDCKVW